MGSLGGRGAWHAQTERDATDQDFVSAALGGDRRALESHQQWIYRIVTNQALFRSHPFYSGKDMIPYLRDLLGTPEFENIFRMN